MRLDDFMYGGDAYGGDMFGAYGGADLPSFAVEPPAPAPAAAPSLAVAPTGYSQTTQAQLDEQNAYLADYIARTGYDTAIARPYQTTVRRGYGDKDIATISTGEPLAEKYKQPQQISEEEAAAMLSEAPPLEQRLVSSFAPETNQGQSGGRLAAKYNTPFRLYDGKELVYEGVGPEAAAEAARLAEQISQEKGAKADWKVEQQFGDKWVTASKDQPDVQGGLLGAVLKYGLPLAASFIPGLNVLATMAVAGAASTGGNLLAGESLKNSLISGGLSAATAGLMKGIAPGAPAGPQLSDTFNAARGAGGALTDVFATSGLGAIGNAAGQAAAQSLGQLAPAAVGGGLGQAIPNELLVTAFKNAAPSLVSQVAPSVVQAGVSGLSNALLPSQPATTQTPLAAQEPPPSLAVPSNEVAGITVTGARPDNILTNVGSALVAAPSLAVQPTTPPVDQTPIAGDEEQINVLANTKPLDVSLGVPLTFGPEPSLAVQPTTPPVEQTPIAGDEEQINVTASKKPLTGFPNVPLTAFGDFTGAEALNAPGTAADTPKKLGVSDYLRLAGLTSSALGLLGGSGGPEGTAAGIVPGGMGRLNPIFSAKLPTGADVNIPGGVGTASNLAARPMSDEDWLTYGQRPEKSFFNYVPDTPEQYQTALAANAPRPTTPRPTTPDSGVPGTAAMPAGVAPAGGSLNNIAASLLPTLATAVGSPLAGLTFGSLNVDWNKFANSKQAQDLFNQLKGAQNAAPVAPTGMAHGGALEAKRGGTSSRSSFAVNGPGTGRSDDIPAVLSDGEYVIDAETVALLGDGSSKAGAQKLDDLRVKIRKHKGQRLSQGRFSSDAKKPEAYLTGGRI